MRRFFKTKINFILIILFFLLINFLGFSQNIKNFFYKISKPFQEILWESGAKTANFIEIFFEIRNLKREKDLCYLENQKLLSEIATLENLKKENKTLKEALELELQKEFKLILVKITGYNSAPDSIFINKGKKDGLSEGLAVITASKALVGKISQVSSHWAEVMLLSHPESYFPGKVLKKEISGLIKGQGNFKITFQDLPKEAEILPGDVVVTTILAPEGVLVGKISEVKFLDISPFQEAKIDPFFQLQKISYLFVVKEF